MNNLLNKHVILANKPEKHPEISDFEVKITPIATPKSGQVLCETQYLSLDPYMRGQIAGRHISGVINPGDTLLAETVSKVIKSTVKEFKTGDLVRCHGGWNSYSVHQANELTKLPHTPLSSSVFLSTLGTTGLTAYVAMMIQSQAKKGDVVVIPAATGGVGAVAGQLAKLLGCKVIGIAGSIEKCHVAVSQLGFDACINRNACNVEQQLKLNCPEGIDVYLDLVGGELLNTVSQQLAIGARVILCGIMSELNGQPRQPGPHPALWIKSRATVMGLVVYDYEDKREEFIQECMTYLLHNKLKSFDQIIEGIENAPSAFCALMRGDNMGKLIIKVN